MMSVLALNSYPFWANYCVCRKIVSSDFIFDVIVSRQVTGVGGDPSFQQIDLGQLSIYILKNEVGHIPHTQLKNLLKMDLNMCKNYKILENIWVKSCNLWLSKIFLNVKPQNKWQKENIMIWLWQIKKLYFLWTSVRK